MKHRRNK